MLKPAFTTAIIGTVFLLLLSFNLEPNLKKISDISNGDLGSFVKLHGKIDNIKQTGSLTIIGISEDNSTINIIADNAQFDVNSSIEVIGKITEWHSILEIEASRIKTI